RKARFSRSGPQEAAMKRTSREVEAERAFLEAEADAQHGHDLNGEVRASGDRQRGIDFEWTTCAQLDGDESELAYIVAGIMPGGQPGISAGPPKTLKTSILLDLGLSIALGEPFLGQHRINRAATVAIMSGESGRSTLRDTARVIARAKGYDLECV